MPSPLITARELASLLGSPALFLIDARSGPTGASSYLLEHLPGAVHAELDRDLAGPAPHPERGGRHPLPDVADFADRLGAWGITPASDVVIYDDESGANAAARAWWMLRAVGHDPDRVRVLDGGLAAARAAGLPLTMERAEREPAPPYPVSSWQLRTADVEEVDVARQDPARLVLDARAPFRFRGEREPIDPVAGHIPGAQNAPFADVLEADGTMRSPEDLRAHFAAMLGPVPAERVIVHCGSGVTACELLLALEHAGLPGAALYVGSWGEWCRQPSRPRGSHDGVAAQRPGTP